VQELLGSRKGLVPEESLAQSRQHHVLVVDDAVESLGHLPQQLTRDDCRSGGDLADFPADVAGGLSVADDHDVLAAGTCQVVEVARGQESAARALEDVDPIERRDEGVGEDAVGDDQVVEGRGRWVGGHLPPILDGRRVGDLGPRRSDGPSPNLSP